MSFPQPGRRTKMRPGIGTLIAAGVCFVGTVVFCGVLLFFSGRAEPGAAEGIGFFSILAVFPCLAAIALTVIGIVQLSRKPR